MNERIQELAVQAGFTGWTQRTTIGLELEKFAELIVRECADICYNREYTDGSRYGDEIIEHFGAK